MSATNTAGVLIVDLQPAYARHGALSAHLMHEVIKHLEATPKALPLLALFVNEELSGDTEDCVKMFWQEHGASDELLQRIHWAEKPYAFLRGWMDQGVTAEEIVCVLQHMHGRGVWDSRDLSIEELEPLCSTGASRDSPLFRDRDVEAVAQRMTRHDGCWNTCGGGRDECLAETELVLQACGVEFERLSHLTY
jgi:hypothetical protein